MERRSLLDCGATPTRENPNVFDDEFEVEDFDGIADGFRPGHNHDREGGGGWRQDQDDVPVHSLSAQYATTSVTPTGPSRNLTRKSRAQENPFASPEDDAELPLQRTPSGNFAPDTARRSASSASSRQFAGTSSPRFGSGGPSHPYAMYPQGTLARTPSAATASTARPQRQSSSRYRPQHPYALYTQGVGDDLDDEHETTPQNPVPVGFLGLGNAFQRRRGPDGEEQDIIGDYGHIEQLPPYTRYPEDGPEKAPLLGVPNPPTALHSRAPVLGTDPAMDLMHTRLQPAQQSMTDASNLQRQPSTMSRASMLHNDDASSSPTSLKSHKSWSEKSWGEKRKTRFCGIPFWCFLLALGVLGFVAAVLGGVIGGFVVGQKKSDSQVLASASTSLYDASLIATAATSQPPATGTYALSLGSSQETQAACLTIPEQIPAWNCDLAGDADISIIIDTPAGNDQPGAYLFTDVGNDTQLAYGTQRSNMQTLFSPFLLVTDNDSPDRGPAFYFQQQYNKVVVVPGDAINQNAKKFKRGFPKNPAAWLSRKEYATPGDKPWFCYWNNTFVEGFIYPNEKAKASPSSASSYPTPPATATSTPQGTASSTTGSSTPSATPWSITWADPWETVATTVDMSTTSCTYTGAASGFPNWMHDNYPYWYKHGDHNGNKNSPPGRKKRSMPYQLDSDGDYDAQQYPYLVKIEERRLPGSPQPYCVQAQVLDNHHWNWVTYPDGEQITIYLSESDPGYSAYLAAGEASNRRLGKRRTIPGECHCQWQSGQ